jgi:outer membrane lipoprotein-sorting protein
MTQLKLEPKSDKFPYAHVEFVVDAQNVIRQVKVFGHDRSVLEFAFENEKRNVALDPKLFEFQLPKGATLIEAGGR